MMQRLKALLLEREAAVEGRGRLSLIKLHNGVGFRNPKVSFIAFVDGQPEYFLKTVRFPADNQVIRRAHERLEVANLAIGTAGAKPTLPKPLWLESVDGFDVSAESIVSGRPLDINNDRERSAVFDWLNVFCAATKDAAYSARELEDFFTRLMAIFKVQDNEIAEYWQRTFAGCMQRAGGQNLSLPRAPAHGDFTPANILWCGAGLGLIDWDRYGDIDMPLFDLLTFT